MFNHKKYRQEYLASSVASNDAELYGVAIEAANVPDGDWHWKIIGVHHLLPSENDGKHNLLMDAVDENGVRITENVAWTWEGRTPNESAPPVVLNQPDTGPAGSLAIWMNQTISARIDHQFSDVITNVHTRHADEPIGNAVGHHSFYVVWQWTKKGKKPAPPPSPQPADSAEEVLLQIKELLDAYFTQK